MSGREYKINCKERGRKGRGGEGRGGEGKGGMWATCTLLMCCRFQIAPKQTFAKRSTNRFITNSCHPK